jgi:hypothetical protein
MASMMRRIAMVVQPRERMRKPPPKFGQWLGFRPCWNYQKLRGELGSAARSQFDIQIFAAAGNLASEKNVPIVRRLVQQLQLRIFHGRFNEPEAIDTGFFCSLMYEKQEITEIGYHYIGYSKNILILEMWSHLYCKAIQFLSIF